MNIVDWKLRMKEALKIHTSEIDSFHRSHHTIKTSMLKYKDNGKRVMLPTEEVYHTTTLTTKIFKRKENYEDSISYIMTGEKDLFTFQTNIKYYTNIDVLMPVSAEYNSGILLQEDSTRGYIVGGSPTLRYGKDEQRIFWNELLDKDEHFNKSLHEKLLSYETYLVMRDMYPFVPVGTLLSVKELFNE